MSNGWQPLREFGLFGGDATEAANSGLMIDYVIHPRIDLTPEMTLSRKVRLNFAVSLVEPEEVPAGVGADLPVSSLDGVGEVYAGDLNRAGIRSLDDLVRFDLLRPVGSIPPARLREFQVKARLVLNLPLRHLAGLEPLSGYSISHILKTRSEALAGLGITPAATRRLQETLAVLQVALDDTQLHQLSLEALAQPHK